MKSVWRRSPSDRLSDRSGGLSLVRHTKSASVPGLSFFEPVSSITGTLALTLSAFSLVAVGNVEVRGAFSQTLSSFSLTASGTVTTPGGGGGSTVLTDAELKRRRARRELLAMSKLERRKFIKKHGAPK